MAIPQILVAVILAAATLGQAYGVVVSWRVPLRSADYVQARRQQLVQAFAGLLLNAVMAVLLIWGGFWS